MPAASSAPISAHGIFEHDPFVTIDRDGVGELMRIAVERGRKTRETLKLGICGEHGGDPASVRFCQEIGLDYVSCSPYRVPIARLAAAQAALSRAADRRPRLDRFPLVRLRREGSRRSPPRSARIERAPEDEATLALLDAAYAGSARAGHRRHRAARGRQIDADRRPDRGLARRGAPVGVIAVDPSSRPPAARCSATARGSGPTPSDAGIFVRSMAARDKLGGLAELTVSAMVLLRALFDIVLMETVGVGQSETDVAGAADTVVFCVQPGSGDSLQFMKAGIVEIPHLVVVTKAISAPPPSARGRRPCGAGACGTCWRGLGSAGGCCSRR